MTEREIYRDPNRDVALLDLSPNIRLSLPMSLFSKYGPLRTDWDELNDKLEEVLELLVMGDSKISVAEALKAENDNG